MEWVHTLTIIVSGFGYTAAVWYVVREDIKRHDIEIHEMRQEFKDVRQEFQQEFKDIRQEMREELSKGHALWANLLEKICTIEKQIFDIKLDQSRKA